MGNLDGRNDSAAGAATQSSTERVRQQSESRALPPMSTEHRARVLRNCPPELAALPNWVCADRRPRKDGASSKKPIDPRTGGDGKSNDPTTWSTIADALAWAERDDRVCAIGVNLLDTDWIALDLDHVLNLSTGELAPAAGRLLDALPTTYCEISPSGDGLRLFFRCTKPEGLATSKENVLGPGTKLEVFGAATGRYVTVTGDTGDTGDQQPIATVEPDDLQVLWDLLQETKRERQQQSQGQQQQHGDDADPERLRAALSWIDSDPRDVWTKVGMALHGLGDLGWQLWCEWSRTSSKFDEQDAAKVWRSFESGHPNRPRLRSIYWRAKQANPNWQRDAPRRDRGAAAEPKTESPKATIDSSVASVIKRFVAMGPVVHEPTGIDGIDRLTGGGPVYGSRVYLVGGPDSGKTLLFVKIADTYVQRGILVGFLAVDEDDVDVLTRLLQRRGATREQCERKQGEELQRAIADVAELPLHIYGPDKTIEQAADDLAAHAQAMGKKAVLFVDSLQTARCDNEKEEASTYSNVTARVGAIRSCATKHRMLIVATSEMGRAHYNTIRADNRPSDMAAAKESGAIEYSARLMLVMRSVPKETALAELRIVKNKHGRRHREDENGIFLRLHTHVQDVVQDNDYRPETPSDRDAEALQEKREDFATLAVWLAEHPGAGTREIERAMAQNSWGKTRTGNAVFGLEEQDAIVVRESGSKSAHYLDGAEVPQSVLELVPPSARLKVLNSTPPQPSEGAA